MREDHTKEESTSQSVKKSTLKRDVEQTGKTQLNPAQRQQHKNDPLREHIDKANKDGKRNTSGTNKGSKEKGMQSCEDTNASPLKKWAKE